MDIQAIIGLGIGGAIAFILIKWLTAKHIPSLIEAFKSEMALERAMHLEAIKMQAFEIKGLADEMRRMAVEARKKERD